MICLPARLPLLQVGEQHLIQYETRWLEHSIATAAESAGHDQWVFSADVARGVIQFLREGFSGSKITLNDLFERISQTLDKIGFPDIAARLEVTPPPVDIPLDAIARESCPACELFFFNELDARVREARASGIERVRFTGLNSALLELDPSRGSDQDSDTKTISHDTLRAEILVFLRRRAAESPGFAFIVK